MANRFNIKRLYEAARRDNNEQRFFDDFSEALEKKEVKADDFSIRELFEELVEDGTTWVSDWHRSSPEDRTLLTEAGVNTTAFSNITGQLLVNEVLGVYNDPVFISDQLCTTVQTRLPKGERIPGLAQIGNEAEAVGEGQPYPIIGFGEDWIDTPETIKRGMICPLTREMIVADLTGQLMERARGVTKWIRYNKEIRILQTALGITSSYNRRSRGVVQTYDDSTGSHDWDNLQASNALVDWTDIENAELLFDAMVDPNTGTPIMVTPNTVVVPTALKHTARRVLHATEVRQGDGSSAGYQTIGGNPVDPYNVVTSQLVKTVTSSTSTWFIGDFKGAVRYAEVSPITTVQAPTNNYDEFHRDIVNQWKVSEWGVPYMYEPRLVVKCTA